MKPQKICGASLEPSWDHPTFVIFKPPHGRAGYIMMLKKKVPEVLTRGAQHLPRKMTS